MNFNTIISYDDVIWLGMNPLWTVEFEILSLGFSFTHEV